MDGILFKKLMRRHCFLLFVCLPRLSFANDKPYIISGYDDVLRQAENTGLVSAAIKVFEKDKTFTGMPELYTAISSDNPDPKFVVVSATSHWFKNRITNFLASSQYPSNSLYLRNWLTQWSIEDFKMEKIQKVLAQKPSRKFIVVFDNSDPSVAMAETFQNNFSDRVSAVYLRQVVKKVLPMNTHPFYTAFDIAVVEALANRMTFREVQTVANAILKEVRTDMVFPSYSLCPTDYNPCDGTKGELKDTCTTVRFHVQSLCRKRESPKSL